MAHCCDWNHCNMSNSMHLNQADVSDGSKFGILIYQAKLRIVCFLNITVPAIR